MVYTSYFASKAKIDEGWIEVCISQFPPKWLPDLQTVKCLAPAPRLLKSYKDGKITKEQCFGIYKQQIETDEEAMNYIVQLIRFAEENTVVLYCYEKDPEDCHRSILAKIIREYGGKAEELKANVDKK